MLQAVATDSIKETTIKVGNISKSISILNRFIFDIKKKENTAITVIEQNKLRNWLRN